MRPPAVKQRAGVYLAASACPAHPEQAGPKEKSGNFKSARFDLEIHQYTEIYKNVQAGQWGKLTYKQLS